MCISRYVKKLVERTGIDFQGITVASLFCGIVFLVASLAATGFDRKVAPHELDVVFKICVWGEFVSIVIGSLSVLAFLLSLSIPYLKKVMEKNGRTILIVSTSLVLYLNVVIINLYIITWLILKFGKKSEIHNPYFGLWSALFGVGLFILSPSLLLKMASKKERDIGDNYKELIDA